MIGMPGDHVTCCTADGKLTINGVAINEPYLDPDNRNPDGTPAPASPDSFDITVPPDRLWVMGDNRNSSADSRYHYTVSHAGIMASTIPISSVIGRAFVLFWPPSRATWLSVPSAFDKVPPPGPAR